MIEIEKFTADVVKVTYKSPYESAVDPTNIANFKPRADFSIEDTLIVPMNQIVELYLAFSFIEKDYRLTRPSKVILLEDINNNAKRIQVFISKNKPNFIQMRYVNYKENKGGILFLETSNLKFGLFLAYLDLVIDKFDILKCILGDLGFIYYRKERTLYITDKYFNMQDSIRIDAHNISLIKALYHTSLTRGFCWDLYLDPDKTVAISNNRLIVNGKRYHQSIFYELGLLLYRY
ncbi:MAG: hypothetical protein RXO36_07335 [Candidatus Nanopusillus acidilobi]